MKRPEERKLQDLVSVGPATQRDLAKLGVHSVADLALSDPLRLYRELCRKTRKQQDPCVLDVYRAAVAQARDPHLPIEQCVWWYWSRRRKQEGSDSLRAPVLRPASSGRPRKSASA